jgi:hypothetical protein
LKDFKYYILHSKTFVFVSTSAIKYILTQPSIEGRKGKWISKLQEYDLEIKPTKLLKGQGLTKIMAESNCKSLDTNSLSTNIMATKQEEDETQESSSKVSPNFVRFVWYRDVIFYL